MQTFIHEFFDIWIAWWNASEPISQHLLWGHPVFFWGRCGKAMELIAAFFLLYEILGREKSSELARKFVETFSFVSTVQRDPVRNFKRVYQRLGEAFRGGFLALIRETWRIWLIWFVVFAAAWSYTQLSDWRDVLILFFASYLGIMVFLIAMMFLFFILAEIARLYSWLAEMEPRLRIVNLAVLAIGIMFDLLAT